MAPRKDLSRQRNAACVAAQKDTCYDLDDVGDSPEAPVDTHSKDALGPGDLHWASLPNQPKSSHLARHLKPITNVSEAFEDLTNNALRNGLRPILTSLAGRTIRIATMCSGTESPIVALELLRDCLKDLDLEFNFEHVFSSEIVHWKQNWILRNFEPKILFRDITEMTEGKAMTVLGELAEIPPPGHIHILVAGFACVDFSTLNNKRKDLVVNLDELPPEQLLDMLGGESSVTLSAILRYARHYRPPILVLENILGASWPQITELLHDINYCVAVARLDTKHFYLPQTRQRGYLIAISSLKVSGIGGMIKSDAESAVQKWSHVLNEFIRPASSPVDDFLLGDDDQDLARSLRDQSREANLVTETDFARDWSICWGRYQRFRERNGLGGKAPYTQWLSGDMKPPEHVQALWLQKQPNRIKDTLDCLHLLSALQPNRDYDINYKSRFPDASQNIDRSIDMAKFGIVGCITPNNIIYHTRKGRVPTGLELLRLQGIDSRRLLVSKESHQQLKDLAGNAMSTTVVGSALIAALIVGFRALDASTWGPAKSIEKDLWIGDRFIFDLRSNLVMANLLNFGPSDSALSILHFQELAALTARKCYCEGSRNLSTAQMLSCRECKHTCCTECAGNPEHDYEVLTTKQRHDPRLFVKTASKFLPTRLRLKGFQALDSLIVDTINDIMFTEKLSRLNSHAGAMKARPEEQSWLTGRKSNQRLEKASKRPNRSMRGRSVVRPASKSPEAVDCGQNMTTACQPEQIMKFYEPCAKASAVIDCSERPPTDNKQNIKPSSRDICDDIGDDYFTKDMLNIAFECEELKMLHLGRSHKWEIMYESEHLKLKLTLHDLFVEWSLYMKPPTSLPAQSIIRSILAHPVATMIPDTQTNSHLWHGNWMAQMYSRREYTIKVFSMGNMVPSWKAELGLKGHENEKVPEKITIFPITEQHTFEDEKVLEKIAGTYQLLPRCGTAKRSLHRKVQSLASDADPMYLFLESSPNEPAEFDDFMIASDHEKLGEGESRRYIGRIRTKKFQSEASSLPIDIERSKYLSALLNCCSSRDQRMLQLYLTRVSSNIKADHFDYRQWSTQSEQQNVVSWHPTEHTHNASFVIDYATRSFQGMLEPVIDCEHHSITASIPEVIVNPNILHPNHDLDTAHCHTADGLLLKYNIPWHGRNPNGRWNAEPCLITELNQHHMQLDLQWLVSRIRLAPQLQLWNPIDVPDTEQCCKVCVPLLRPFTQRQIPSGGLLPMEDPETVSEFLKSWKDKPVPVSIFTRRSKDKANRQDLCVTVNVKCLTHRLLAGIPQMQPAKCIKLETSWRICTGVEVDYGDNDLGSLKIHDCSRESPLIYRFGESGFCLREDQARVFRWIVNREAPDTELFMEIITEENVSRHLLWSVEAQAIRMVRVRGGLCADHVGFGKTVVLLATIKNNIQQARKEASHAREHGPQGQIPIRATLVLVPKSLAYQWADEIHKFWSECKFLLITSPDDLFRYSVSDYHDIDVVIAAIDLFVQARDTQYTNRVAEIAGVANPARFVLLRQYVEWCKSTNKKVAAFVKDLRDDRLSATKCMDNLRERSYEYRFTTAEYLDPSMRLKGKQFAIAQREKLLGVKEYLSTRVYSENAVRRPGEVRGFPIRVRSTAEIAVVSDRSKARRKLLKAKFRSQRPLEDKLSIKFKDKISKNAMLPHSGIYKRALMLSVSKNRYGKELPKVNQRQQTSKVFLNHDEKDFLGPVFSMFCFHRKIVDEISYLSRYQEEAIKSIPSNITWLLSGTARVRDPMDVKRLAALIGVHTGADDDSYGRNVEENRKAVNNARSDTEKIEASKVLHTVAWHKRRLIVAQAFLDRFARMNQVELPLGSKIRLKEFIYPVRLPALHAALYHECRTLLASEGFKDNLSYTGHGRHDRSMRLHFVLHNTKTIEEALIKAAFYVPRAEGYSMMQHACHELPNLDYQQVLDARADDITRLVRAVIRRANAFLAWSQCQKFQCVDRRSANYVLDLLKRLTWQLNTKLFGGSLDSDVLSHLQRLHWKYRLPFTRPPIMTHRQARRRLERLGKLLDSMTSAVRSFRFLKNAQRLQQITWNQDESFLVDDMGHVSSSCNIRLSGLCGHILCQRCFRETGETTCPVQGCLAGAGVKTYVHADDLAESSPDSESSSVKIDTVAQIIKALEKDAQALVFSQWHAMNEILVYHLERSGLSTTYIRSGERTTAQKVTAFKNLPFGHPDWSKVMILNPLSNTAAGHNLQSVNAVIFLSPLSASSIDDYKSAYVQCIGRAARFGQQSIVKVYHILVSRTVEVNIHESRRATKLYVDDGQAVEVAPDVVLSGARGLAIEGYSPRLPV